MNYLFIGAHTDDIELSCGGWIQQLLKAKHQVRCYTASYLNSVDLLQEHMDSMDKLGVTNYTVSIFKNRTISYYRQDLLNELINYREAYEPDVVVTHHPNDIHQDHAAVSKETMRAFKNSSIIYYIAPWNGQPEPNYWVTLSSNEVEKKIDALKCYESQNHRFYMQPATIRHNTSTGRWPDFIYCESFTIAQLFCGFSH
jgi:LmbE family N-acetylglucosaminyl deacetylase